MSAEGLLEPVRADVGVDPGVEHQREVSDREPLAHAVEVLDAARLKPAPAGARARAGYPALRTSVGLVGA